MNPFMQLLPNPTTCEFLALAVGVLSHVRLVSAFFDGLHRICTKGCKHKGRKDDMSSVAVTWTKTWEPTPFSPRFSCMGRDRSEGRVCVCVCGAR